jgi:DNA-binding winged helix-turn-helix (wHTH) protein/tetratricopeptide (TPR) repeat protein
VTFWDRFGSILVIKRGAFDSWENSPEMKLFHSFRLDTVNHCLWAGEERIRLTPKAFDVLRFLIDRAERVVTQEEILEAVWPGIYVNPEVVKKYILEIRRVLGDSRDKSAFIQTVHKRGYQFIARVRDEHDAPAIDDGMQPAGIVGREAAVAKLSHHFRRAMAGRCQVVFITGEAGIGKTTLIDAFQPSVRPYTTRIARGQCVEGFGGNEAYYPVLEALAQLTRDADNNPVVQVLAKRAPTWLIQFAWLVQPEQQALLQKEILGATRERMLREMCEALEVLSQEMPVLLIFEDLHWVDPSTLDLISAVARRRGQSRLMIIGTYRPLDVDISQSPLKRLKQDLLVHQLCAEIALEPLTEPDIAKYLIAQFPHWSFSSGLATIIHQHSGGNALFMSIIVRDMIDKGLITSEEGLWKLTKRLEEIEPAVPETLQQLLETQFECLSESQQRVLSTASVARNCFSVSIIASALGLDADKVEVVCDGLAKKQQFIRSAGICEFPSGGASAQYQFRHSLYRDFVYSRLPTGSRSKLHREIGEELEALWTNAVIEIASEVAVHFEEGRDYQKAIKYFVRGAENATRRFEYRQAIDTLEHALLLVPKIERNAQAQKTVQILESIGDIQYVLGSMADSAKAYEAAAAHALEAGLTANHINTLSCLSRPLAVVDPGRGLDVIRKAEQVSIAHGDPLLQARTQLLAASSRLVYDAWQPEDRRLCMRARQEIKRLSDSKILGYEQTFYSYVQALQGDYRGALETAEAGLSNLNNAGNPLVYLSAIGGRLLALLRLGELGEVLRIIRTGYEMAEKNGNDPWFFNFREAWLRTLAFDFEGARGVCEGALRRNSGYPTTQARTIARLAAGYADLHSGRYDQAIHSFHEVLELKSTPKFFLHWIWRMTAQHGLSNVWLDAGDLSNARKAADCFLESALSTADPYLHVLAWEMRARIAVKRHVWMEAEESIREALAVLHNFEIPLAAWRAHATAWEFYRETNQDAVAEEHRQSARTAIFRIADSFQPEEQLRKLFLSAHAIKGFVPEIVN